MKRYSISDKELTKHFKNEKFKPEYGSYESGGRTIHYAEIGHDSLPLVILVHGAPGGWSGYLNFFTDTALLSKVKIIAVDRPGYGKSGYGNSETSIKKQAAMLKPLLEKNRSGMPAVIVGRSFGGPVVARMAMDYPDLIGGMVMIAPAVDPETEKFVWCSKLGKIPFINWMLPKYMKVATDEKYSHTRELSEMMPLWQNICAPVTILQGLSDKLVNPSNATFAEKMMTNAPKECYFIEGAPHSICSYRPDLVRDAILKHVSTLSAQPVVFE